jgi:hypothetical protein
MSSGPDCRVRHELQPLAHVARAHPVAPPDGGYWVIDMRERDARAHREVPPCEG